MKDVHTERAKEKSRKANPRHVDREAENKKASHKKTKPVEDQMDETLENSFPASDPPSWNTARSKQEREKKH